MPGVRYKDAYSSGREAPGVTTVNAGDAMNGTSSATCAARRRQIAQPNVAWYVVPRSNCSAGCSFVALVEPSSRATSTRESAAAYAGKPPSRNRVVTTERMRMTASMSRLRIRFHDVDRIASADTS